MSLPIVSVRSDDVLVREGAEAYLGGLEALRLHTGTAEEPPPDVLLILVGSVTATTLAWMRDAARPGGGPRTVLVAGRISEAQLLRAVELGLASLLLRSEADYPRIVRAVLGVGDQTLLPGAVMRSLVDYLRRAQTDLGSPYGLSPREVEVLGMIARGMDTAEIAGRLRYSERTIKNILNAVMKRLDLRNRAHAVSYALRAGLI
jgi:DNA-binding NarL/FixJ family response regulator